MIYPDRSDTDAYIWLFKITKHVTNGYQGFYLECDDQDKYLYRIKRKKYLVIFGNLMYNYEKPVIVCERHTSNSYKLTDSDRDRLATIYNRENSLEPEIQI